MQHVLNTVPCTTIHKPAPHTQGMSWPGGHDTNQMSVPLGTLGQCWWTWGVCWMKRLLCARCISPWTRNVIGGRQMPCMSLDHGQFGCWVGILAVR